MVSNKEARLLGYKDRLHYKYYPHLIPDSVVITIKYSNGTGPKEEATDDEKRMIEEWRNEPRTMEPTEDEIRILGLRRK